jgi:hypothetical protein
MQKQCQLFAASRKIFTKANKINKLKIWRWENAGRARLMWQRFAIEDCHLSGNRQVL